MTREATIHVVPADAPKGRDHSPSRTCWCGPVHFGHSMTQPRVIVVRHRVPPPPPGRAFYPLDEQDRRLLGQEP